ncbi:MAG: FapA family protein, partial [Lachnospiraceae bacterium]|nr:FapA family protein [Lachnospiraceae bacterium]
STGDVEYDGNIDIMGNVNSNYKVKATGDINIKGVVEAAEIEAGGSVIIARGMNGMGKGKITAGGNVVAKFLENVDVSAQGYVSSESIMHCHVDAGTEVQVDGKRGFISGGRVSAANMIHAKTLGSSMGGDTVIEVGNDPSIKTRIREIQDRLAELQKTQKTIAPVIAAWKQKLQGGQKLPNDKLTQIQVLAKSLVDSEKEAEELNTELTELKEKTMEAHSAYVQVHDDVYPGTRICIGDASVTIKNPQSYCRFVRDKGEVRTKSY